MAVRKGNIGAVLILSAISLSTAGAKPRLLPPSAFPELPPAVIQTLQARGCQIPQIQRRKRDNVIRGEFLKSGQTDWAVLCTTKKLTELLVLENGSADQVVVIASFSNGFAKWTIGPIAAHDFPKEWLLKDGSLPLDHDGISSFAEFGYRVDGCLYCY